MSESNNYGVSLGFQFTSFDSVNKEYQTILKRLADTGKIKLSAEFDKSKLLSIADEFKQVVNQKVVFDTSGASTQFTTLRNSANELLTIINKYNNQKELTSTSYSASSKAQLEAQVGIYKQLTNLQKNEFDLKNQMITADGTHYQELNNQLQITKQLMASTGKALNNNGLTNEKLTSELMQRRLELQNKLNSSSSKVTDNNNKAQISAEIKVWEQYEAELVKVNATKQRLTTSTNIAKGDGVNNSAIQNLKNQINGINVNTKSTDIDRITASVNNLGKSSSKVLTLTTEIDKFKSKIAEIKSTSSDALGLGGNESKLATFTSAMENADSVLGRLKKNSQSVTMTEFKKAILDVKSSFGSLSEGVGQIETAKTKLASVQAMISKLGDNGAYKSSFITSLQKELNSLNINTPIGKIEEFKTKVQSLGGSSENGIVKLTKNIDDFGNKIIALRSKYSGLVPETQLNEFNTLLNGLKTKLESMKSGQIIDGSKLSSEINNINSSYQKLTQSTRDSSLAFKTGNQDVRSFGSTLTNTASKFGIYLSSAIVFRKLFSEIKSGLEYVKYLDNSFTDMAMTMNITKTQFTDMSSQIDEMAKKLGVTSQYVHDIARVYSNSNTTVNEVMQKVKGASQLANISGMSGEETTKSLQSITNEFKLMSVEGANAGDVTSRIGDVLTKISQNMSYDFSDGIKEMNSAISTSGSVAEMAGESLESYSARIGALVQSTGKSGEELANGYKMIASRVLQIKSVASEEGIDDSEMANAEKAMSKMGVSIRDGENGLRNFDDVLADVAKKWGGLGDQEKQNYAEALAGTRKQKASYVEKFA